MHWIRARKGIGVASMLLVILFPHTLRAYVPLVVGTDPGDEPFPIEDLQREQYFYGVLDTTPHLYVLTSTDPFLLTLRILVPEMEGVHTDVNTIIVKREGRQGSVVEVARVLSRDGSWELFREPIGGDEYKRGGGYEQELEPGTYFLEVSAPNNDTPYVLVVGNEEGKGDISYGDMLVRISDVKVFYGHSRLWVLESPYGYVPVLLLIALGGGVWWYRRRTYAS